VLDPRIKNVYFESEWEEDWQLLAMEKIKHMVCFLSIVFSCAGNDSNILVFL